MYNVSALKRECFHVLYLNLRETETALAMKCGKVPWSFDVVCHQHDSM
jgi:hypothetical protein